jgi:hypothetical protein
MSTVFVLKPIIDVLYEEVSQYKNEIERLKKIISEQNEIIERKTAEASVKPVNIVEKSVKAVENGVNIIGERDDDAYAALAEAPPASSPPQVLLEQVENQNEIIENHTSTQEDSKVVKLIGGKDKKEYMKEYHRNYRKKQKENQQKNNSVSK